MGAVAAVPATPTDVGSSPTLVPAAAGPSAVPDPAVVAAPTSVSSAPARRRRDALPWLIGIAAAVVISVVASRSSSPDGSTNSWRRRNARSRASRPSRPRRSRSPRIPESERVALVSTGAEAAAAPRSRHHRELVVVASGLDEPPSARRFPLLVLVDGERVDVGRMKFSGYFAYYGRIPTERGRRAWTGTTFGVSLTELDGQEPRPTRSSSATSESLTAPPAGSASGGRHIGRGDQPGARSRQAERHVPSTNEHAPEAQAALPDLLSARPRSFSAAPRLGLTRRRTLRRRSHESRRSRP